MIVIDRAQQIEPIDAGQNSPCHTRPATSIDLQENQAIPPVFVIGMAKRVLRQARKKPTARIAAEREVERAFADLPAL